MNFLFRLIAIKSCHKFSGLRQKLGTKHIKKNERDNNKPTAIKYCIPYEKYGNIFKLYITV